MILLNHLRPIPPVVLILQILLIPGQRPLLHDASIGRQIDLVQQPLDIPDPLLQLVHRRIVGFLAGHLDLLAGGRCVVGAIAVFALGTGVAAIAVVSVLGGMGHGGGRSGDVARHDGAEGQYPVWIPRGLGWVEDWKQMMKRKEK